MNKPWLLIIRVSWGEGGASKLYFQEGGALNYLLVEFSVFTARNSAKKAAGSF